MKREKKSTIPEDFSTKTGAVIKRLFEKNVPSATTVVKKTTVVPTSEKEDNKTTVVEKPTEAKKTTVVLKHTVTFVTYQEAFNESDPNYWFKYVVVLHWLMDNFFPKLRFRTSSVYARLIRLAYGIKNNKGVCKVGSKALTRSSGITKKYVRQGIKELKELGAISILETENKGPKGGGSIYRVLIPKEALETVVKKTTVVKMNTVVKDNPIIFDDPYNIYQHHLEEVKKIYSEITGNTWCKSDDESYLKIRNFNIETIERALRILTENAKTHPNTFEFFVKQIQQLGNIFEDNPIKGVELTSNSSLSTEDQTDDETFNHKGRVGTENDDINALRLPGGSYFQEKWLINYLSGFPKEEQQKIKRLAEQFDHFMLSAGKKKDWIKNPTGTFIELVRGKVNVSLPQDAPSFEERVEEEKRAEQKRLEREREELEWEEENKRQREIKEKIIKEINDKISTLKEEKLNEFIRRIRERYDFRKTESDRSILERVAYFIHGELEKSRGDWREIWDKIHKGD